MEQLRDIQGLAPSGFGRRTNHPAGDSRRTPRKPACLRAARTDRPWTAGENEREPCRDINL